MLLFLLGDVWSGLEVETTAQCMNQFQMWDIIIQSLKIFNNFFIKLKNQEPIVLLPVFYMVALLSNQNYQMALNGVSGTNDQPNFSMCTLKYYTNVK